MSISLDKVSNLMLTHCFSKKAPKPTLSLLALAMLCVTSNSHAQNISGSVVDKEGQPVVGAVVSLGHHFKTIKTDSQGAYRFSDIEEGNFELHVEADDYTHAYQEVLVGADNIDNLNVVLNTSVIEVIDIHAVPLHASVIRSALPINVIGEDELKMKQASTLGETLKHEVGVHSSYYGPVSSTPIIRGLDGPRVLITQNGLDVGDASRVGPDHVVATETSTATQIEVLRGPATLFYGSGAIGGVVNVVDQRIPTTKDDKVDYLLQYNDVSNERQASVDMQTSVDNVAFHLDGFWRDSNDYKIAGPADIHEEEEGEEGEDRLDNSASNSSGLTFGSSYLFDDGFIGGSYGVMEKEYGIPGHSHSHEHEEEEDHEDEESEDVFAEMKQSKLQLLGEYNFKQQFINKIASKFAYTDYEHQEIEDGAIGTTFTNDSVEARVDLFHENYMGWKGAWTVHYKSSDFEAIGEEAFAPPSKSSMFALAWLEEKHFGDVLLQLGARVEHVTLNADDTTIGFEDEHEHEEDEHEEGDHDETTLVSFEQQTFTPFSASAGLVWDYHSGYNLGLSVAFSQRAPSAGELFSFGPHIGTSTFEVGAMFDIHQEEDGEYHAELAEVAPDVETSLNMDVTLRKFEGDFGYILSAFYNQVDNYYYQQNTGLYYDDGTLYDEQVDEDALPILVYNQDDVVMYGGEAEFIYQVSPALKMNVFADYIRAKLVNNDVNDNLPRIPPLRIGALLQYQGNSYDGEIGVSHYFDQDDIAELETSTDGYTMLDASFNYYIDGIGNDFVVYVKGENLTNENARVHSSFLKDVAPLPGRNLSIGVRGGF